MKKKEDLLSKLVIKTKFTNENDNEFFKTVFLDNEDVICKNFVSSSLSGVYKRGEEGKIEYLKNLLLKRIKTDSQFFEKSFEKTVNDIINDEVDNKQNKKSSKKTVNDIINDEVDNKQNEKSSKKTANDIINDEVDNKQNKRLKTTRVENKTNIVNRKLNGDGGGTDDSGSDDSGSDDSGSDGSNLENTFQTNKRKRGTKKKTHSKNLKEEVLNSFKESGNQKLNINNLPLSPIQNIIKNSIDMDIEPTLLNDNFKEEKDLAGSSLKFSIVLNDSEINLTKAGIQTLLQENDQNYKVVLNKCLSKIESNNNSIINTILSSTKNITDDSFIKLDNNNLKEKFEILWFKNQQQQYEIDQLKVQLKQSQYKQYLNTPQTLQDSDEENEKEKEKSKNQKKIVTNILKQTIRHWFKANIDNFLYINEEDGPKQLFELVNKEIQSNRNILNKNKWTQRFIRTTINTSKKKLKEDGEEKINYLILLLIDFQLLKKELIRALISEKLHHIEPVNEKQIEGFEKFLLGTKIGFKKHEVDGEEVKEEDEDEDEDEDDGDGNGDGDDNDDDNDDDDKDDDDEEDDEDDEDEDEDDKDNYQKLLAKLAPEIELYRNNKKQNNKTKNPTTKKNPTNKKNKKQKNKITSISSTEDSPIKYIIGDGSNILNFIYYINKSKESFSNSFKPLFSELNTSIERIELDCCGLLNINTFSNLLNNKSIKFLYLYDSDFIVYSSKQTDGDDCSVGDGSNYYGSDDRGNDNSSGDDSDDDDDDGSEVLQEETFSINQYLFDNIFSSPLTSIRHYKICFKELKELKFIFNLILNNIFKLQLYSLIFEFYDNKLIGEFIKEFKNLIYNISTQQQQQQQQKQQKSKNINLKEIKIKGYNKYLEELNNVINPYFKTIIKNYQQ
ncbi:hypothetical protein ACTFIR_012063 [Dictyostelium discoideum]